MSSHSFHSLAPLPSLVKYRPLVLITGFLGAGKTTFLRDLLGQVKAQNLTADVILNDYENAALDAETLHGKAESIAALAASCACCDGLSDLVQLAVTAQATRSSVLVVELNGTADPLPLLESFTLLENKLHFRPRWQVCVVDARHFGKREEFSALEILQLHTASHFVISHTAGVDRTALIVRVRSINPHATEITAARLSSHLAATIAAMQPAVSYGQQTEVKLPHRNGHHLAHAFTGCQILLPPRVREKTILGWLAALPDSVYRAKALVSLIDSPEVRHLFERVAGDIMPNPLEVPITQRVPPSAILIGPRLDPAGLLELSHQHFGPLAKFPEEPSPQPAHVHV
jgi:G3E family GTPase